MKFAHLIIITYLLTAFLIVGTMEFNDHLNRVDHQASATENWRQ